MVTAAQAIDYASEMLLAVLEVLEAVAELAAAIASLALAIVSFDPSASSEVA